MRVRTADTISIAEAISDRLMASSQTTDVKGDSFRPSQGTKNKLENEEN